MISVICRIDDNGIVREAGILERFKEAANRVIDPGDHTVVGSYIGLIFLRSVPAPKEPLTSDAGLKKIWKIIENGGVTQLGWSNVGVSVKLVCGLRPSEMPDARTTIAIFSMTCIKPHIEGKGLVFWLSFQEVDSLVHDEIGFVAKSSIGKLFEEWISPNDFNFIKVCLSIKLARRPNMPFSKITSTVVVFSEQVGIENFKRFSPDTVAVSRGPITAGSHSGKN